MREVVDVQCGRRPDCLFASAPGGNGLLMPSPSRLQQLIQRDPIHDSYLVEELPFARGQFASVRECVHKRTGERFAAKVLRKRRRLQDAYHEIAVLDAFTACNRIVQLQEVYETATEIILVLELVTGGEMQSLLDAEEYIKEEEVVRFMRQILQGLRQLHDSNIAHLDIKPQNLLLTGPFPNCDVKLCDFGISRQICHGGELREIMGTADYMAPEILNYEPLSLATDLWSVGVLTYALLTGYTPFTGANNQETYCNITSQEVDFPEDLFSDISDMAKDFIAGLLVKNPRGRRSVQECLEHPWLSTTVQSALVPLSAASDQETTSIIKDSGFNSLASSDDESSLIQPALELTSLNRPSSPPTSLNQSNSPPAGLSQPSSPSTGLSKAKSLLTSLNQSVSSLTSLNQSASPLASLNHCSSSLTSLHQYASLSQSAAPVQDGDARNGNGLAAPRRPSRSSVTGAYTIVNGAYTLERALVANVVPVDNRQLTASSAGEEEVSDVTSEASSGGSDRASEMSWEEAEAEFSYRRLSVSQLTDRVWDCFDSHAFSVQQVRPWESVCTGAVGRAKARFQAKPAPARPLHHV